MVGGKESERSYFGEVEVESLEYFTFHLLDLMAGVGVSSNFFVFLEMGRINLFILASYPKTGYS